MDHLAPTPRVAGLRQPATPELDRLLEETEDGILGLVVEEPVLSHHLEHEGARLAGAEREATLHPPLGRLEPHARAQRERQLRRVEHAVVVDQRRVVLDASVVEARLADDRHRDAPAHAEHPAYERLTGEACALADWHEVLDLAHTRGSQKARDQDIRVG